MFLEIQIHLSHIVCHLFTVFKFKGQVSKLL